MPKLFSFLTATATAIALMLSQHAAADWTLSPDSTISFISTKNINVTEVHHFSGISGQMDAKGEAELFIDLSSAETGIDIRNERLASMLFDVAKFANASITASVPEGVLNAAAKGQISMADINAALSLHGLQHSIQATVMIAPTQDGQVLVTTRNPILLKASDFALVDGIESLRSIAGLDSISTTIPVTFSLLFSEQ
ncbi:MAG: YceI family protein [Oleibacter sp.]|nr:YceI family protein [Thalassolituus sp.]